MLGLNKRAQEVCKPQESEAGINHIDMVIFIVSHSFLNIDMTSFIHLCFKLKQDTNKTVRSLDCEDYASCIILFHSFWVIVPCILESQHFCTS